METIGDRIRDMRMQKGLSQHKLAEISGVSRSYLIEIEENKYNLSAVVLCKLAKSLEVTPNDLIPSFMYR